jgi:four helix bundle protein
VTIQNYRDLIVWQRAMDLVASVYRVTHDWPKDERYGLTNQVRRAAVSIPSNVAEGQGRNSDNEFLRFLAIAHGSLREVETQLLIALRLDDNDSQIIGPVMDEAAEVGRLIQGLTRRIR